MNKTKPTTIDEYIAEFPANTQIPLPPTLFAV